MILAVSLNPALDVTHHVAGVDWSGVNRPRQVTVAPGGKALNVARTLRALGSEVLVIGLAGGVTGEAVRAGLAGSGVPGRFTPIAGETRRTFAVVDTRSHDTALFNEPGPAVADGEYREFLVMYENALPGCDAVVLSGSLPPGLPPDTYAGLAARAAAVAVPVVLDAGGPAGDRAGGRRARRGRAAGRGSGGGRGVARRRRPARGHRRGNLARGAAGPGGGQPDRSRRRRGRRPGARAGARAAVGGTAAARGRARHRGGGGAGRRAVRRGRLRAGAGRDPGHPLEGPLMPAAGMAEIVGPARAAGRGVGAFNIIGIEHAEAVIAGAEAAGAPVVLAISQNCV